MRKEVTQKQKDQWKETQRKGVAKYQERLKKKVLVPKKRIPVLKSRPKKTYKINKVSKKQAKLNAQYSKKRKIWFQKGENQICKINMSEGCTKDDPRPATDVHHSYGRIGEMLLDDTEWIPGCRTCHDQAHKKDAEAKKKGVSGLRLSK